MVFNSTIKYKYTDPCTKQFIANVLYLTSVLNDWILTKKLDTEFVVHQHKLIIKTNKIAETCDKQQLMSKKKLKKYNPPK